MPAGDAGIPNVKGWCHKSWSNPYIVVQCQNVPVNTCLRVYETHTTPLYTVHVLLCIENLGGICYGVLI